MSSTPERLPGVATFVRTTAQTDKGHQILVRCEPPIGNPAVEHGAKYEYAIVSAADVTFGFSTGPETYIFGADEEGTRISGALPGSFRGELDHKEALRRAGYALVYAVEQDEGAPPHPTVLSTDLTLRLPIAFEMTGDWRTDREWVDRVTTAVEAAAGVRGSAYRADDECWHFRLHCSGYPRFHAMKELFDRLAVVCASIEAPVAPAMTEREVRWTLTNAVFRAVCRRRGTVPTRGACEDVAELATERMPEAALDAAVAIYAAGFPASEIVPEAELAYEDTLLAIYDKLGEDEDTDADQDTDADDDIDYHDDYTGV